MTTLRVRKLAEERGLNIQTLSRRADLSYTTAHNLWHGGMKQLNIRTLNSVARVLGVTVSELFEGQPEDSDVVEVSGQYEAVAFAA